MRNQLFTPTFSSNELNFVKKIPSVWHLNKISIELVRTMYVIYTVPSKYAYRKNLLELPQLRKVSISPFIPLINFNFSWQSYITNFQK